MICYQDISNVHSLLTCFQGKKKEKNYDVSTYFFQLFFLSFPLCEIFGCLDDIIFLRLLYDVMQWLGINHRLGYSNQHTSRCNRIRIYIGIYTMVQCSIVHWRRERGRGKEMLYAISTVYTRAIVSIEHKRTLNFYYSCSSLCKKKLFFSLNASSCQLIVFILLLYTFSIYQDGSIWKSSRM